MPRELLADAALLTSELVTNAVRFTTAIVTVAIETDDRSIAVAVADDSPDPPALEEASQDSASGRGLQLVNLLASAWGWKPTSDERGKVVWFRVGR